jgi:hypothetical protein
VEKSLLLNKEGIYPVGLIKISHRVNRRSKLIPITYLITIG